MERNTVTEVKHLLPGDRFYKQKDKSKKVYEKVEEKPKETQYQTYKHFAKVPGQKFAIPFKSDTMVVFLRSAAGVLILLLNSCKNGANPIAINHAFMVNVAFFLFYLWLVLYILLVLIKPKSRYKSNQD